VSNDWGPGPNDDWRRLPDRFDDSARRRNDETIYDLFATPDGQRDSSERQYHERPQHPDYGRPGHAEQADRGAYGGDTYRDEGRQVRSGPQQYPHPAFGVTAPDGWSRGRLDAPPTQAGYGATSYRPRVQTRSTPLGPGGGPRPVVRNIRLARLVWFATAAGTCVGAGAVTLSTKGSGIAFPLFWLALFIPFGVQTAALMSVKMSDRLRQVIIALVGLYPSILRRMSSPLVLAGYDEHLHERQLSDLLHGSGLFAPNPMLSVGPFYPGLEILTGTAVRLTSMSALLGETIIPLLARLLLVLLLYYSAKTVLPDVRSASLVVVFYAISPQFYAFNSQFAYQTLALTLGLGGIYLIRQAQFSAGARRRRFVVAASLAMAGTVITHHATSWFFAGFLVLWALAARRRERKPVAQLAGITVGAVAVWTAAISSQLAGYFGPVISSAATELGSTAQGSSQAHAFSGTPPNVSPEWEHLLLIFYAVVCALAAVICGMRLIVWAYRRKNGCYAVIGFLSLCYPATLAAHFISATAEIGDRSSTFLFFPLALSVAAVIAETRSSWMSAMRKVPFAILTPVVVVLCSLYIGGVVLGAGPDYNMLPGPYLVSADVRTQDPYTLAAVEWAEGHLSPGSRVVADRVPSGLLSAEARLWPVIAPSNGLEPAGLYFSPTWTSYQTSIVRGLHIQYIYVDSRLSESLPHVGFYFYAGETSTPQQLTTDELGKFAQVSGLKAVYHLGPVTIYSTAGFGVSPDPTGFTGNKPMGLGTVGDFLAGIFVFVVGFLVRGRLKWVIRATRELGPVGTTVVTMALLIMLGGVLFELRGMPGPGFALGFIASFLVAGFAKFGLAQATRGGIRKALGSGALDPIILFAVLGIVLGVAVATRSAYQTDVSSVHALLQQAGL